MFTSIASLAQHDSVIHAWECPDCPVRLSSESYLADHQRREGHSACGECNKVFGSSQELHAHAQATGHSSEFRCCDCERNFKSDQALKQHLRDKKVHRPPLPPPQLHARDDKTTFKCPKCPRGFASAQAMQQHLESPRHCPVSNLDCISNSCGKKFVTPSGLFHHLESGKCPSGMDRESLNDLVLTHDTDRLITRASDPTNELLHNISSLSIESDVSSDDEDEPGIMTPTSDGGASLPLPSDSDVLTPSRGSISIDSWEDLVARSSDMRCPFCPPERGPFCNETALQQHLQSPAHAERLFFCPTAFLGSLGNKGGSLRNTFTTVSGLSQHLESGACKGGSTTFKKVVAYLEVRLRAVNINMKLISS
ncbi:hypothetical protein N3K66_006171 [Trichothecium roseum]|uniref:Uncharacterized protein n=1 Tax=Trichothecium roseum TaxID=47278 RepID=A0ACC0V0N5_9HYPO|nr:hypothetical protein N3K66_006171 [Trichothecium roseum]